MQSVRPDSSLSQNTSSATSVSFDARHYFLFSKAAESFGISASLIESFASRGENVTVLSDFLKENGTQRLLFYYQQREGRDEKQNRAPKLMITSGEKAGLTGKACYFLRTSSKAISMSNFEQEILCGVIEAHLLNELLVFLQTAVIPALKEDHAAWGELISGVNLAKPSAESDANTVVRFREMMERFVGTIGEAWNSLRDVIDLATFEAGLLDGLENSPASYKKGAASPALVEKLEALLSSWCHQIEHVLAESEQVRQETDETGPMAELEYWKVRMGRFTKLMDQLKTRECKIVVGVLTQAKSRTIQVWKDLDNRITDAANEAKDNVKYLYTLEKFTEAMYKGEPRAVMDSVPGLINSISMMYNIARYYNTPERMTSLFVKITNQMILCCRKYIKKDGSFWRQSKEILTPKLFACIELNQIYQDYFRQTKLKMQQVPNGKQFEFSEIYIFGKFQQFCKRLDMLVVLVDIMDQFKQLTSCRHVDGIPEVLNDFKILVAQLRVKFDTPQNDVLDHRTPVFDQEFEIFQDKVRALESRLRTIITDSFRNARSTEAALLLLESFTPLLQREQYRADLDSKYMLIFTTYGKELDHVKNLYEKFKEVPPISRNTPPVAGAVAWARQLLHRIEKPMQVFQKQPAVLQAPEAKPIIRTYNRVASALIEFEALWIQGWLQAVDAVKSGLLATLLVRDDTSALFVNFDFQILQLLRETTCLLRIGGVEVPPTAVMIKAQEAKFKANYDDLTECLREAQTVLSNIQPSYEKLMRPLIRDLDSCITPGLTTLTWTSMNIETYISSINNSIRRIQEVVLKANDIIDCRILSIFSGIETTPLCDLGSGTWPLVDLPSKTRDVAISRGQDIELRSMEAETAVGDLITVATSRYPDDVSHSAAFLAETKQEIFESYSKLLFTSLVACSKNSMNLLRNRVLSTDLVPFYKSEIHLAVPNIVLRPSVDEIVRYLGNTGQSILLAWRNISAWGQDRSDKDNLDNMFVEVGSDKDVLRSVLNLVGQLEKHGRTGLNYLEQFAKYRFLWASDDDLEDAALNAAAAAANAPGSLDSLISGEVSARDLYTISAQTRYDKFISSKPTLDDYDRVFEELNGVAREISALPNDHRIAAWLLDSTPVKAALIDLVELWKQRYGANLVKIASKDLLIMDRFIDDMNQHLVRPIEDLDDVRATMLKLLELRENEVDMEFRIRPVEEAYALLLRHEVKIPQGGLEGVDALSYRWNKLLATAAAASNTLHTVHVDFKSDLLSSVQAFAVDVKSFFEDYQNHGPNVKGIKPRVAVERLKAFQRGFEERDRKYQGYRQGEELFGLPYTDYPELNQIRKELGLLSRLYDLYVDVLTTVDGYGDQLWSEVSFEVINNQIQDFQQRCRKLPKAMREWEAYTELRDRIDNFVETLPLMEKLASKSMRPRHWQQVQDTVKTEFNLDVDTFKLKHLMDVPLLENRDAIEEITNSADKEAGIEIKLTSIQDDWSATKFSFAPFKNKEDMLLKGTETIEIITALEDTQMTLGGMMGSRYIGPFKKSLEEWQRRLATCSEVIELWLQVQALWAYLEAVFTGGDIARQLPLEAKRFLGIDKQWAKIMQRSSANPFVVDVCYKDDMVRNLLPHLMEQLELCQKSLSGYLETKRSLFPRFYFVSDPVLLEILGQGSDPNAVQPHLKSVFDNIAKIEFDTHRKTEIVAMESSEGERMPLVKTMHAEGNVETWMTSLEEHMQKTMKSVIEQVASLVSQGDTDWEKFIETYPAQAVIIGYQLVWTRICEDALIKAKTERGILNKTNQRVGQMLADLSKMTIRKLTPLQRTKIETLITIQVHQVDVFDKIVRDKVRGSTDFEWTKQTRFYWKTEQDDCIISICDIDFNYAYEYLGCSERLVITPLTDRCYITLSQALGMYLGGAPAGPAGTGKTETVKDMGKCLGKFVVVFNCSDQMDYRGLGKIFKGLAQSGSWGCFDEFNRIELPVLSVVAQQVACVFAALKEHKTEFQFVDGQTLRLRGSCGFFITMNPGYAGRQELPENLKTLFRSVSMMVPDRQIIMRVKLAAAGFLEAKDLAQKFAILYRLCEEQLSKQRHYDFGLRNILSVLRTTGSARRASPDATETLILMRTLRDMNLSKLVGDDESLFLSLIEDLFPGEKVEKAHYDDIEKSIAAEVARKGLILHPDWQIKVVQLYETALVRHGIMVLGPSGSGKTTVIRTLLTALTEVVAQHKEVRLNPKSFTASQMFGKLDVATNDWTDGIFSSIWRTAARQKKFHTWMCLDGPVDALWIENLNTVLDDNKLLTLANSDRIPMTPLMKIVFEVENLDNASPATVSRAGIIYLSSTSLGWKPVFESWLARFGKSSATSETIRQVYGAIVDDAFVFLRDNCLLIMKNSQVNDVMASLKYLGKLFSDAEKSDALAANKSGDSVVSESHLRRLITFSLVWGLGGRLESADRVRLHQFLAKYRELDLPTMGPQDKFYNEGDTVFDYVVDENSGNWVHWQSRVPSWSYPKPDRKAAVEFHSLIVPTADNVRTNFLINLIATQKESVLLIGEPGTAKTISINSWLNAQNTKDLVFKSVNFSYATTPQIFQRIIEGSIEKRQGHTYGPMNNRSRMVIFIDDINMPEVNKWGDQTTNELVRTLMEDGGFYDLDHPGEYSTVKGLQFIAAMNHPGAGKNDIPNRLKRHFTVVNLTLPSAQSVELIFGSIIRGHFSEMHGFPADVINIASKLAAATAELWSATKEKLLPTPAKFHYIFNLRDFSRITQGLLTSGSEIVNRVDTLLKLWKHECTRVIPDKFTNAEDKKWFFSQMNRTVSRHFSLELAESLAQQESLWVDFLREDTEDENSDGPPKIYEPIPSFPALKDRLDLLMNQFNEFKYIRGTILDLVLFEDAMVHLARISRIIRQKRGNALLIGVGGSGKQSLTRLASFVAGYHMFQIQISKTYNTQNLIEDLKEVYKTAGGKGIPVTFLITDAEIKNEEFLEFINNILTSGEISNLFAKDELEMILQDIRPLLAIQRPHLNDTHDNLYAFFIDRVRDNLHLVLCFSPIGDKFRQRCRKFPGLVSGCTIDWFSAWPADALLAVASKIMGNFELENEKWVKDSLVQFMAIVHDQVGKTAEDYFTKFRKHVYVTPKSYLSFLDSYVKLYNIKAAEIAKLHKELTNGLEQLRKAGRDVADMQIQLEAKEKELAQAQKVSAVFLEEITANTAVAEKAKKEVEGTKEELRVKAELIHAQKEEAERDLAAAKPALEAAEEALRQIKPADIQVLKKLNNPPHLIKRVMDGVMILKLYPISNPTRVEELQDGTMTIQPTWAAAVRMMNSGDFLNTLLDFPRDQINGETIELLQPYLEMPDFTYETAKRMSGNVAGLASWIKAMKDYFFIAREVAPKREAVFQAEQSLSKATIELNKAQSELDQKQAELDQMQAKYDKAMAEKTRLQESAMLTRRRMTSANSLISGLASEKERWTKQATEFADLTKRLVGDTAISVAVISYAGPFNEDFRRVLVDNWSKLLLQREIPYTRELSVTQFLVDDATVWGWNLEGLPTDDLSIQNGILVTKSSKFPLLIDPQGQGKAWIIQREEAKKRLIVTSFNDKQFKTHLENAMGNGQALLIEDIEDEIDPMLDNVLDKQLIKVGRQFRVKVGDQEVDYHPDFNLYLTTKLPNPHFQPEVCARTAVIDFTVTIAGLEAQLLGRVLHHEQAGLEEQRQSLLNEVNSNKKRVKELEDALLERLSNTKGNMVDDDELISVLTNTKVIAQEVLEKIATAFETEKKINTMREEYRPVAARGAVIYFVVAEMSLVSPMYQTSLSQFLGLFDRSIVHADKSPIPRVRISNIIDYGTYDIFRFISRGYFENHKLLFLFLLCLKIELRAGLISADEFNTLVKGGAALDANRVRARPHDWIPEKAWLNLAMLQERVPVFKHVLDYIERGEEQWKKWFDLEKPEAAKVPDGYQKIFDQAREKSASEIHKLLLVRCWREDRTMIAANEYIVSTLSRGKPDDTRFINPIPLDLERTVEEAGPTTPIVCILSLGSDPTDNIISLAARRRIDLKAISMGQGQERDAGILVNNAIARGGWVLLQNCHLGIPFLLELEGIMTKITADRSAHPDFQVWITCEPTRAFPITLLQASIKVTNEAPQGIKAGLKRTFGTMTEELFNAIEKPQWKPVLYGICFLHTIVQERRKFGPLGWCVPYEFNQSDLTASIQYLQNTLYASDPKKPLSWPSIRYMICEVHYGGRITDDMDRVLMNNFGEHWLHDGITTKGFTFSKGYTIPIADPTDKLDRVRTAIEELPLYDSPEAFGLHPNADITYRTKQTDDILSTIVDIQPKDSAASAGSESRETIVQRIIEEYQSKLPADFNPTQAKARVRKVDGAQFTPLSIFLLQEIDRMQVVLSLVRSMLRDLALAIQGTVIMSQRLVETLDALFNARVPPSWLEVSWPSSSLGYWFQDVIGRCTQLSSWLNEGRPKVYWLAGFFNPQGFLTAMRQEISRARGWPLDTVRLSTEVLAKDKEAIRHPPEEGVYISGLYLDGCAYNVTSGKLVDSQLGAKNLMFQMPVIHVSATNNPSKPLNTVPVPVYKYPNRTDNNFIFFCDLKIGEGGSQRKWILRGAALTASRV